MDGTTRMPLADLIHAVRLELQEAADRAANEQLKFEVGEVDLQVEVLSTGSRDVEGGIKLWVLNVGGKGTRTQSNAHTVTLHLTASGPEGTRLKVEDEPKRPVRRTSR
jgi:hypothetical protein